MSIKVENYERSFLIRSFSFCASAAAILNRAASTSAFIRFWTCSTVSCVRLLFCDWRSVGDFWCCGRWVFWSKIAPDADCSKSGNSDGLGPYVEGEALNLVSSILVLFIYYFIGGICIKGLVFCVFCVGETLSVRKSKGVRAFRSILKMSYTSYLKTVTDFN